MVLPVNPDVSYVVTLTRTKIHFNLYLSFMTSQTILFSYQKDNISWLKFVCHVYDYSELKTQSCFWLTILLCFRSGQLRRSNMMMPSPSKGWKTNMWRSSITWREWFHSSRNWFQMWVISNLNGKGKLITKI